MKKIIYSLCILLALAFSTNSNAQAFTFTMSPNGCQNSWNPASVTSTAAGATNYTWTALSPNSCSVSVWQNNVNANFLFTCTGVYTIICNAYNGSTFISSISQTVNVNPAPNMGYTGNTQLCSGGSATITFNSPGSYTWSPGNLVTGSVAIITPTGSSTGYTVMSNNGCTGYTFVPITVTNQPTVNILGASGGTICSNNVLTASGASNYTWLPGGATTSTIQVTTATCYTLIGSNACGIDSVVQCVTPVASPTVSISGNAPICAGGSVTLTASGASNYSWSPSSSTSASIVVSPSSQGQYNYYVYGYNNAWSCSSWAMVTVTVGTSQYINVSNVGACNGTRTLTATGGSGFVWSVGGSTFATGPSVVVTPTANTCYTVTAPPSGTFTCPGFAVHCVSLSPSPTISIYGTPTLCSGWNSNNWISAGGASSYTWFPGNIASQWIPAPNASTCYTVIGTSASGCTASASQCFSVVPVTPLTITGNTNICQGGSSTFTLGGASNYTLYSWWNTTWASGSTFVVTPSVSSVYTVIATNSQGCTGWLNFSITVIPNPNVTISGNTPICPGQSASLVASGLVNYSWSNGPTTAANVVSPTSTTCYTVSGTSANGCSGSAVACVIVNPAPAVTISGNNTVCLGSSLNLTASGANFYTWSINATGNIINVNPTANTCYSVIGTSASGCTAMASSCVTVQTTNLSITASSPTVCLGTSVSYTASGANSYTWNSTANSSTVNVIPATNTVYTVMGTGPNGCIGSATVSVGVDTTCSDVWPGDANSDGVVNSSDVLEIGLAFSATGSSRSPGGNTYVAQHANNWAGTVSSGKNKAHADCNGDGVVNSGDTLAIFNNFSMTHSFRPAAQSAGDLSLFTPGNLALVGEWNKVDVMLGDASNVISQLYGLTFDITIDQYYLEPNSVYLVYTPSFLNASNQNVEFRKSILSNDKIYAASVRTDFTEVSGQGKIAELWFKVRPDADVNTSFDITISSGGKINNTGNVSNVSGVTESIELRGNPVGIKTNTSLNNNNFSVYPNPASGVLLLQSSNSENVGYTVTNVLGQEVINGTFNGTTSVDVSSLTPGTYLISFKSNSGITHKKVVVQ